MVLTDEVSVDELRALGSVRTLTIQQASWLANMEREKLDAAIRANQLRIMRIPGVKRVHRDELERWLESLITPLESL
nr:hypothetical protein [Armatimonas sp.]